MERARAKTGPLRIAIVAGEPSGDLLAAELIRAIHACVPNADFEGVTGPQMMEAGCRTLHSIDTLSVMGLTEVAREIWRLSRLRQSLVKYFSDHPPDLFVGVDAPDFNLGLEGRLKRQGIAVAHLVSPSVWAWRRYRIRKIARSVDLMLTLFPFEADYYRAQNVPVEFIGHPLADHIPDQVNSRQAREALDLLPNNPVIALLPGSRTAEIDALAAIFVSAASWCAQRRSGLQFVVPLANSRVRKRFQARVAATETPVALHLRDGQALQAMSAADVVLAASGTATLEALLLQRPMVVAYRLSRLSYALARRFIRVPYVSLPNLLAGTCLVPEFIQDDATPEALGQAVLDLLDNRKGCRKLKEKFTEIRSTLQRGAAQRAANAVLALVGR